MSSVITAVDKRNDKKMKKQREELEIFCSKVPVIHVKWYGVIKKWAYISLKCIFANSRATTTFFKNIICFIYQEKR